MDDRLRQRALTRGGPCVARDVRDLGVDANDVATAVRSGPLRRLRRGTFVLGELYDPLPTSEQYILKVRAVLLDRGLGVYASHHAALALHGVDTYAVDRRCVDLVGQVQHTQRRSGVATRPARELPLVHRQGDRMVSLAMALVQVIVTSGEVAGQCSVDHALAAAAVSDGEIRAVLRHVDPRRHARVERVLLHADRQCESVGETRVRLLLIAFGIPFVAQAVLRDPDGRFVARVDFLLWGCVVLEFDGRVKYEGLRGGEVLVAEKVRESAVTALHYEVERAIWTDLDDEAQLLARLAAAQRRARVRGPVLGTAVRTRDGELTSPARRLHLPKVWPG